MAGWPVRRTREASPWGFIRHAPAKDSEGENSNTSEAGPAFRGRVVRRVLRGWRRRMMR